MLAKIIQDDLEKLDFNPKLKTEIIPLCINRSIILSDGNGTNYSKNPKLYIINDLVSPNMRSPRLYARMLASRAVRRRVQTSMPDIDLFGRDVLVSEKFVEKIDYLAFSTSDEYELDAEIIARIGGYLYLCNASLKECQEILTLDASCIVEKYGETFITKCIDI
ncbi:MAG TPA: hypothetical protein PKU93_01420 [Candidatus Pacearchaeota archaeon]|nr:hypothetical protein [Candidatus Pacearchaeota archaeon]